MYAPTVKAELKPSDLPEYGGETDEEAISYFHDVQKLANFGGYMLDMSTIVRYSRLFQLYSYPEP